MKLNVHCETKNFSMTYKFCKCEYNIQEKGDTETQIGKVNTHFKRVKKI